MGMPEPGYQQAGIEIQKKEDFRALQSSLQRVFSAPLLERFLRKLESKKIRIREFDAVLDKKILEQVDAVLAKSGRSARSLYEALSVPDQGQMREFYLTQLEAVDLDTREKFAPIYRYY
jgi:hypothetical protein